MGAVFASLDDVLESLKIRVNVKMGGPTVVVGALIVVAQTPFL